MSREIFRNSRKNRAERGIHISPGDASNPPMRSSVESSGQAIEQDTNVPLGPRAVAVLASRCLATANPGALVLGSVVEDCACSEF